DPDIVMNSSNYAVAAWEGVYNNAPFPSVVIYATRSSDGTWNPAQILFAGANFDQPVNINLALNEAGTTVAAWRLQTSTGENTQVSFLPFGGSWSTPLMISTAEDGGSGDNKPFPAINENGNVVVSWQSKIVNDFGIDVATYNAATNTWSRPLILDSTPGDNVCANPRSAIDANGNAIVAWRKDTTIYASYFDGTSWGPPVDLSSVLGPTEPALDPDVVMDAQGNATVLWSTNGLNEQVFSSSRLPNGTWTTPVAISGGPFDSFSSFMSQNPLSVANNGDMMSIWGSNDTIFADYRPFGSQWLPFEIVASGSNIYLNIGLTSCGLGIAVWLETEVVASMNYNMLLPQNARAKKCCDKFTVQKRCLNILKWDPSPCAKYFNIYRDGVLIDSVS